MRYLGRTGLQVSAISFGAMTFGGARSDFFRPVGTTELDEARRQVDLCLDAGVNLFDTADVYSDGASEEILGAALGGRRDDVLLATKLHGRAGPGVNDLRPVAPPHDPGASTPACGAWARTGSTSSRCTASTAAPTPRRRCAPWTTSCAPGRCATSAAPTSAPGT